MALPLIPSNQMQPTNPDVSLDQALQMFQGTMQRTGLVRALQEANQQVNQVQESSIKEQEKMAAMNQIARGLAFQMMATGANSAQIEQATGLVKPRQIQSADDAILRGSLAGDQDLVQKGLQADYLSAANKLAVLEAQQKKASAPALKQADIDFESNSAAAMRNLASLEKTISRYGNVESSNVLSLASNKKAAADLQQLYLDTAIAYAKIVDPTSVAREGEVETAKKYAIPAGLMTSNKTTIAAIKGMRQKILDRIKDRRALRAQGKLPDDEAALMEQQSTSAVPSYFTPVK